MTHRREQGFTLLELMIVVGIIAMIASIAIMAYVNSLDRARQKRTMSDMRVIATAWEARATELRSYGVPGFEFPANSATYEDLNEALVPTYSRNLPQNDGWGRPYEFATGSRPKDYAIRSAGRDGVFQEGEYVQGETQHPDCDVVYANGAFVVYPGTLAK